MATRQFQVNVIAHDGIEPVGAFDTYEGAHYDAYGIYIQTGLHTEVLRGDELIWDARNGFHNA